MYAANRQIIRGLNPEEREVDERYKTDPIAWMVERMKVEENTLRWAMNPGYENHTWDGDEEPFVNAAHALGAGEWVAMESATGTGKTFFAALTALWFLDVFEDARVVTIAPKSDQLKLHLWKEVRTLFPRFKVLNNSARLLAMELRMRPGPQGKWGMVGFPVGVGGAEESATRAQGFHQEHLLFITEETPGVHPAVMNAISQTLVGGPRNQWLALGNPDHVQDPLHLFAERNSVTSFRISAYDHPNVVADDRRIVVSAVTRESIDRRIEDAPSEDDPLLLSRTRGICPADTENGLLKMKWLRDAVLRAQEMPEELKSLGPKAVGVDVANSENGDKSCYAYGEGGLLLEVEAKPCPDANVFGAEVVTRAKADGIEPWHVGVDQIGVGAGTVNEMTRLGFYCVALDSSGSPIVDEGAEVFKNLRSQMWWQLRRDLYNGLVGFAFEDEELFRQLLSVRWATKNGKITVESKEKLKKRLGKSPDKADGVVYWNWVRVLRDSGVLIGRA